MRRTIPASAAALAAVMSLAACSGGTTPPTSTTAPPASGATTVYRWGVVGDNGKIVASERHTPTVVPGISGRVVQIATSNSDGYALTSSGEVFAWGADSYSELGNGTRQVYTGRAVRVDFPAGVRIARLPDPMPFDAGMAIDSTGHIWAWGLDAGHDLCLTRRVLGRPRTLPLSDVTLATGAGVHALYVAHGRLLACGTNSAGELGTGTMARGGIGPAPVVGLPGSERIAAVTSSWEDSGALLADGTYYDWGFNRSGQLGDGGRTDSPSPVRVHLPGAVVEVFQGGSFATNGQTIALLANGSVWAWGNDHAGQLGIGSLRSSLVPVPVPAPTGAHFVQVSTGGFASYAVDSTGHVWAWGVNALGQLGTAPQALIATLPVEVDVHLTAVSSTAGNVVGFWRQR